MIKNLFIIILFTLSTPIIKSDPLVEARQNIEHPAVSVLSEISGAGSISCIAEDHDGYIWMSTLSVGLLRYNGTNYVRFSANNNPTSISANVVNTVFVDSQGEVWAGTQKGVNRYLRESSSFEHYEMDDNNNYIMNIFEDSNGRIFASTRRSLFLLDKLNNVFFKKITFENATNAKVFVDNNNDLWITDDSSIKHYNSNFVLVGTYEAPMPIIWAVFDGSNSIYILSYPGMCKFDINSLKYVDIPEALKVVDATGVQLMNNLGTNMIVWITNKGQFCYNYITDKLYTENDIEFPYKVPRNTSINYIFKDSNNNVWFALANGYIKSIALERETNPDHILTDYLEGKNVGRMATTGRYVWIVTDQKYLTTYDIVNKEITFVEISTLINRELGVNKIINLYYSQDGRLLLNLDNNVYEFSVNNGILKFEHFYISNMLSPYLLMVVDDSGTLWTGGGNDNIQYSPKNNFDGTNIRFKKFNIKNETTQVQVSAIGKLKNGTIIIAYSDLGIIMVNPQTMDYRNIHLPEEFKQMYINNLYEDNEGRIWIGTTDIGLFVYDPSLDKTEQIEMFKDLNVRHIVEDESGQLLILCESTLYKLNSINNQFEPIWTNNSELPQDIDLLPLPDGNILLKSTGRFFSVSLAAPMQKNILSKIDVVITNGNEVIDVKEYNEMDSGKAEIVLPSRLNGINIFLSTLNYYDYNPINYSYKIGARRNNEWTELLNNPELQLHYLSYGNNRIQLRVEPILNTNESRIYNLNIRVCVHGIFVRQLWWFTCFV